MMWLWIVIGIVAGLVLVGLLLWAIGSRLPKDHEVSSTLRINRPLAEVYAVIRDVRRWPEWDTGVTRVEPHPAQDGREAWHLHMGRNHFDLVVTREDAPRLLERAISETGGQQYFSGRWVHELSDDGGECVVKLTELGTIHKAIPRALARTVFDPAMYLKRHLKNLSEKFGEAPRLG